MANVASVVRRPPRRKKKKERKKNRQNLPLESVPTKTEARGKAGNSFAFINRGSLNSEILVSVWRSAVVIMAQPGAQC